LLRGPQTPGELRTRTERMCPFEDLADVQSTLGHLMQRQPPLVRMLPRQPGTKEARCVHLLSGDVGVEETAPVPLDTDDERIAILEETVRGLDKKIAELQQQLTDFRKQFE